MNFILKIVEGPNKGAEIALVSGVPVTFGKGEDCDIVLADPTLPAEPISIEASEVGVTTDGEPLEPLEVKTVGATSFAVGPADEPWGKLKWPERGKDPTQSRREAEGAEEGDDGLESHTPSEPRSESPAEPPQEKEKKGRGGCCGCLVALVILLFALAAAAWFFRDRLKESRERLRESGRFDRIYEIGREWYSKFASRSDEPGEPAAPKVVSLSDIAARYGLSLKEGDGPAKLSGNLKTRAERLRATAEAYETRPGVELDLSDDESFRAAADDALFTLTEGALKVLSATNRVLSIGGISRSPEALGRTLRALNADLPRLRSMDTAQVRFGISPSHETAEVGRGGAPAAASGVLHRPSKKSDAHSLPVCGILTKPYPCLVMRDGTRVLEGASVSGNVILKIDADAVTVTNSTGRFVWKP